MTKGILMDVGDTIIHNININYENGLSIIFDLAIAPKISKDIYLKYGNTIFDEIFKERSLIEFKMIDCIKLLNKKFNLKFSISLDELEEIFALNCCQIELVDNIEEVLLYFNRKNYKVIVLSNTSFSKNVIKRMLGKLNKYFTDIIVSSEFPLRKPHYSIFDIGVTKLDINKEDIYYIGNSFYYDVKGSIDSGINCIWFNEYNHKPDDFNKEYLEIKSYLELIDMGF